jgi:opacity protein-like surface antigen
MKKGLLLSAFLVIIAASSFAQDAAFSQGSSTFSVGYGFGNIWRTLFKLSGAKVSATGPVALVYEYGAAEKISVGVSLGYSKITGKYTDPSDPTFTSQESLTNISALARANYHFGSSEKFDPYLGIGLGYYHFKYEYKDSDGDTNGGAFAIPGAFGFSGQLGAKYYFSPQFGLYAEVGYVGGSIAQIGLTAKF